MSDPRTAEERFQDWLDAGADWVQATGWQRELWKQRQAETIGAILKKHRFEFEVWGEKFWESPRGRWILRLCGDRDA